eukprot:56276_1
MKRRIDGIITDNDNNINNPTKKQKLSIMHSLFKLQLIEYLQQYYRPSNEECISFEALFKSFIQFTVIANRICAMRTNTNANRFVWDHNNATFHEYSPLIRCALEISFKDKIHSVSDPVAIVRILTPKRKVIFRVSKNKRKSVRQKRDNQKQLIVSLFRASSFEYILSFILIQCIFLDTHHIIEFQQYICFIESIKYYQ